MTDLRKAAEQALEALGRAHPISNSDKHLSAHSEAMAALLRALAQPDEVLAEREACAKVCETFYNHEAKDCAEAIRERGER